MDKWQTKMNTNALATELWMRKLLRAANKLQELRKERKRLVSGPKGKLKIARPNIADIPHMAGGGSDFNDEIPG